VPPCEDFGTSAFNDVVFTRMPGSGQSAIAVTINGDVLACWWGDGVIVATPTGSTAYSFATASPIVSPGLGTSVVTPLAPHGTFHGSFVLSGEPTVTVDVLQLGGPVAVELDGRPRRERQPRRHDHPDRHAPDCAVSSFSPGICVSATR
jgi:NAD+ kinase